MMQWFTNFVLPQNLSGLHGGSTGQGNFAPVAIYLVPKAHPHPLQKTYPTRPHRGGPPYSGLGAPQFLLKYYSARWTGVSGWAPNGRRSGPDCTFVLTFPEADEVERGFSNRIGCNVCAVRGCVLYSYDLPAFENALFRRC